jgi:hypothetical protein
LSWIKAPWPQLRSDDKQKTEEDFAGRGPAAMLTFEDCLGLSELTEEEILAIAEHEHIPELAALEMGNYLVHSLNGEKQIKRFILEDIAVARKEHDYKHAAVLKIVLRHYCQEHRV